MRAIVCGLAGDRHRRVLLVGYGTLAAGSSEPERNVDGRDLERAAGDGAQDFLTHFRKVSDVNVELVWGGAGHALAAPPKGAPTGDIFFSTDPPRGSPPARAQRPSPRTRSNVRDVKDEALAVGMYERTLAGSRTGRATSGSPSTRI
jgi:hypothetical protein